MRRDGAPERRAAAVARAGHDRGQALPLLTVVLALVVMVALGLVREGCMVTDRARARTAADAAALAGVRDGEDMAATVAEDNHGELRSYVSRGDQVEVTVRVGDAEAVARAERRW